MPVIELPKSQIRLGFFTELGLTAERRFNARVDAAAAEMFLLFGKSETIDIPTLKSSVVYPGDVVNAAMWLLIDNDIVELSSIRELEITDVGRIALGSI
jgi:hypothetical protein